MLYPLELRARVGSIVLAPRRGRLNRQTVRRLRKIAIRIPPACAARSVDPLAT